MTTLKLAVYGTLKSSHQNHNILGEEAKVIARGIRLPEMTMYEHLMGWYPVVVRDPEGFGIEVEVVEIPDFLLSVVDDYEGVRSGLYKRETVTLPNGDEALMYFYNFTDPRNSSLFKPIPSGRWEDTLDEEVPI